MLFKYLPSERVDVLENLKIRFSPLRSLNDPYESLPLIDVDEIIQETIELHSHELDEIWAKTDQSEKTPENKITLEENRSAMIRGVKSSISHEIIGNGLIDMLGDSFGVLSLSRSKNSLLMWSHYASSNTGFVIGFDDSNDFFHQKDLEGNIVHPSAVKYSEQRAIVKNNHHNWRENLLCHKPLEWAYEQEERLFMALMDESKSIGKDEFGADIILNDIPPNVIREVYIGCNASQQTKLKIFNAIQAHKLDCIVFESCMSSKEYKIIFTAKNA